MVVAFVVVVVCVVGLVVVDLVVAVGEIVTVTGGGSTV